MEPDQRPEAIIEIPRLSEADEDLLSGKEDAGLSLKEAKQLSSGKTAEELAEEAARKEHNRTQKFRDAFEQLILCGIRFAFVCAMLLGVTWIWHLLTPTSMHWLTDTQLDHIQSIVTGGLLASLVGDHFKRRLG